MNSSDNIAYKKSFLKRINRGVLLFLIFLVALVVYTVVINAINKDRKQKMITFNEFLNKEYQEVLLVSEDEYERYSALGGFKRTEAIKADLRKRFEAHFLSEDSLFTDFLESTSRQIDDRVSEGKYIKTGSFVIDYIYAKNGYSGRPTYTFEDVGSVCVDLISIKYEELENKSGQIGASQYNRDFRNVTNSSYRYVKDEWKVVAFGEFDLYGY